jgi:hypothetical protein
MPGADRLPASHRQNCALRRKQQGISTAAGQERQASASQNCMAICDGILALKYRMPKVSDDCGRAVNRKGRTVEDVQQVSVTILVDSQIPSQNRNAAQYLWFFLKPHGAGLCPNHVARREIAALNYPKRIKVRC